MVLSLKPTFIKTSNMSVMIRYITASALLGMSSCYFWRGMWNKQNEQGFTYFVSSFMTPVILVAALPYDLSQRTINEYTDYILIGACSATILGAKYRSENNRLLSDL